MSGGIILPNGKPADQRGVLGEGILAEAQSRVKKKEGLDAVRSIALHEGAQDMKMMMDQALNDIGAAHEYVHVDAMKQLINQFYTSYIS